MKKYLLPGVIFILLAVILLNAAPVSKNGADEDPYSAFRLHIIANSDSVRDQQVKLAVRDALLDYERELFDSSAHSPENSAETQALLMENASGMLDTVKSTLTEYGMEYSASLHVGDYTFPDREYGDKLYPAGEYRALRVVLGNGGGKNWWCVMFPPLCIVEDGSGENVGDTVEIKSWFAEVVDWVKGLFSES